MALASSMAHAGEGKSFGTVSGNIDFASEYVFRGLPSSGNSAAVSGGLDWNYNSVYAGTWMSNVGSDDTGNEVDVYAGLTVGDFDFGAIAYLYPADVDSDGPSVDTNGDGVLDSGLDGGFRQSKILEVYAGYSKDMFSGYIYYGANSAGRADDDYIYLDANLTAPVSDAIDLSLHLGYTIFHGKTYDFGNPNYMDDMFDAGVKISHASGLWVGVTSIFESNTVRGYKRPRVNIGYSMTFDDIYDIVLNL